jgi:hypothetical protein
MKRLIMTAGGDPNGVSVDWIWNDADFLDRYLPSMFKSMVKSHHSGQASEDDVELLKTLISDALGPGAVVSHLVFSSKFPYLLNVDLVI